MPMLFSVAEHLRENEQLFAFLDDICFVRDTGRIGDVLQLLQRELWNHARISLHLGKTKVWNRAGIRQPGCEEMLRAAVLVDPNARVWRGDTSTPPSEQSLKILGTPVGQPKYLTAKLQELSAKHKGFCWNEYMFVVDLLCGDTCELHSRKRATSWASQFVRQHDANVWQCFCEVNPDQVTTSSMRTASLLLGLGVLGVGSLEGTFLAAHWTSWADSLAMIQARHPAVAGTIVKALDTNVAALVARELRGCVDTLQTADCVVPPLVELADGLRPFPFRDEEEPSGTKHGWQRVAGDCLENKSLEFVIPTLSACGQALLRSQTGPQNLSCAFRPTCIPHSLVPQSPPPSPLDSSCRCGHLLHAFGHHLSAWRVQLPAFAAKQVPG